MKMDVSSKKMNLTRAGKNSVGVICNALNLNINFFIYRQAAMLFLRQESK
ncbi:hypothetical protein [Winslowiella iniecta]|nr:hypothetical protein [Winslowiella iniecta]